MLSVCLISEMGKIADSVITEAFERGPRPQSEVGFVATFLLRAVSRIASSWKPLCASAGVSLAVRSVFCHSAPQVEFPGAAGKDRCELADLLVVVDRFTLGNMTRHACLIQAKMAGRAERVFLSNPSSRTQLELYQKWPPFDFIEKSYAMTNILFNDRAPDVDRSASIGVIDRHLYNYPGVWTQHRSSPTPAIIKANDIRLGPFIANMIARNSPSGRLATPLAGSDYSKVVERLLSITYNRLFKHRPTLGIGVERIRGVTAFALLQLNKIAEFYEEIGNDGPPAGVEIIEEERPEGISTLHIVLRDPE